MEWRNDVLSFSGFEYGVSKLEKLAEENSDDRKPDSGNVSITPLEELNENEFTDQNENKVVQVEKCEFDPMTERKIENFYFRNVEQAEKKMKKLTHLKSRWSEPCRPGDEVVAKVFLKPKNYENPWKEKETQEKEIAESLKNHQRKSCVIS